MFTGIVEALGRVRDVQRRGTDRRLRVEAAALGLDDVRPGDSIAVNGVCLSAVEVDAQGFAADVSAETLACTTFGSLVPGARVNLEKALLPTTRLGGHLVSGHVDGIGRIEEVRPAGDCRLLRIVVPRELSRYIATKGSVCVDGVSLTVNGVEGCAFSVNIIPHTIAHTIIADYGAGTEVNIEVDVIARYLERLVAGGTAAGGRVDEALLREYGFIKDAQDA